MESSKVLGTIYGLIIGIVLVWLGPLEAFIVALFGLLGWLIGKYIAGDIPILDILLERFVLNRNRDRRR